MKLIVFIVLCIQCSLAQGNTDTLYIIKQPSSIGIANTHFCSFLSNTTFSRTNFNLQINSGDTLNLTVINLDSLDHTFTIDGVIETNNSISPLDTLNIQILPLADGTYRYYSNPPHGKFLGASGILQIGYEQYKRYCWNLFDVDVDLSDSIAMGMATNISEGYQPSYFFINGNYYPNTITDTLTAINGKLGDTIIVSVVNSGNMTNSIHSHGYHFKIISAKKNTMQIGWLKDSSPFVQTEAATLMIVAHQTGWYPIHTHNLIATTTGGIYPGGMITTINIIP